MKAKAFFILIFLLSILSVKAQQNDSIQIWSLNDCINHALTQNIQVRQSILNNLSYEVNANQAVNQKLPSVAGSVRQNFGWSNETDPINGELNFAGNNSTSYSINSSVVVYNGFKLNSLIKQAELDMQSGIYDSETIKESISLSILNAYLQVLFNEENVKNAEKQLESTTQQLNLAQERLNMGIISRSDYLQVKSQLASEKLSLSNANSQYTISKVSLMQLMELPVSDNFAISQPLLDETVNTNILPNAAEVYALALGLKPEVKSAEYQKESAALNEKIAATGYYPSLTADAGIGTAYSNLSGNGYFGQLNDKVSPTVGLTLSIPIFQKKQVKTNVSLAKINYQNAELTEINVKNQLRKEIEQACVDVVSSQTGYEASREQFEAVEESYTLAEEKFNNGLINSVDFLFEKTNLIVAESQLLQSKYTLIFNYKILDFYIGNPINL